MPTRRPTPVLLAALTAVALLTCACKREDPKPPTTTRDVDPRGAATSLDKFSAPDPRDAPAPPDPPTAPAATLPAQPPAPTPSKTSP